MKKKLFLATMLACAMCLAGTGCGKENEETKKPEATVEAGGLDVKDITDAGKKADAAAKPVASTNPSAGDKKEEGAANQTGKEANGTVKATEAPKTEVKATEKPVSTVKATEAPKAAATATPKPNVTAKPADTSGDGGSANTSPAVTAKPAEAPKPEAPKATATPKPEAPKATEAPKPTEEPRVEVPPAPTAVPTAAPTPEPTATPAPVHEHRFVEKRTGEVTCISSAWVVEACECGAYQNGHWEEALGCDYEEYVISDGNCNLPATIGQRCTRCGFEGPTRLGDNNPDEHDFVTRTEDVFDEATFTWGKKEVTYCRGCGAKP